MEIKRSANKHGISNSQIIHAFRQAIDTFDLEEGVTMIIGPDHTGQLLEIGVVDGPTVVHAMPARKKYLR